MFTKNLRLLAFMAFAIILLFTACNKKETRATQLPDSVRSYVYGYTSGIISKASPVRVRFANAVVDSSEVGDDASKVIQLSPAVAGEAIWENDKTLLFTPNEALPSGTTYVATVNLNKVIDNLPKEAQSFQFDFRTRDQFFEVQTNGYDAPNPKDLTKQEFSGSLYTADVADAAQIEQTVTAKQNGKTLPVRWEHEQGQLAHNFYVTEINRGSQPSEVELQWNGKPMDVVLRGEKEVEVPSLKDFKVTDARVEQDQEQYILLFFSDPLSETQNLDGLVSINNYNGTLRTAVDGNQVRVYPSERIVGERKILVNPGVKNLNNKSMSNASNWQVEFQDVKPQVRLVGRGVILPNSKGLIFPFEAISLNAVDIEVFKIYNNNILQFLQTNELDGNNYDLYRVGRVIMQKKIVLNDLNARARTTEWTRYALDLSKMIEKDPDAMYQIRIGYRSAYASYACGADSSNLANAVDDLAPLETKMSEDGEYISMMDDYYGADGYYEGYNYNQRSNPCYKEYYNPERFIQRNVIASNLGIIAKGGNDNSYFVTVSDLRTTDAMGGVTLEFYDFQQQLLTSASTGGDGTATVQLPRKAFVVVAKKDKEKGYLRLEDGNALSLSRFDVAGEVTQKGLKGFMYGERGVWRPGDSVYLNFVLEDRANKLPANYPITFELSDPRGQLQERRTVSPSAGDVYSLYFVTNPDAPTGSWTAKVKAGGAEFNQIVRIETVKPNRLRIDLNFGKKELRASEEPIAGNLSASWLYGAPAKNLRASIETQLTAVPTTFTKYKDFQFDDPARSFYAEPKTVFDGTLDEKSSAKVSANLLDNKLVPGKLSASFRTRVFEKGGDFSSDNFTIPYHPFNNYAGVAIPVSKYGEKQVEFEKATPIEFVSVDPNGNPQRNRNLSVGLYRVEWRWWWDQGYDDVSRYNTADHYDALQKQTLTTNAQGEVNWNVTVTEWGRYLVRVCDTESGHCSGDYFYAGSPEGDESARSAAAMLSFKSNKEKYNVGETVTLTIPTGEEGKALITLENGTKVVKSFTMDSKKGENKFTFKATADMTPNVYAHVELIQPHGQVKNDLPIRMYGVVPILIEDPNTRLAPVLNMPSELKPEQNITVEVSEKSGKAMTYTVAVVDEGLLGLTRFKTPNPWESFFAREALGVRTWDVYDMVLGAYGGELERILSIGGDAGINRKAAQDRANRFKPVVLHLGPFQLGRGGKAKHQIKIPNYIGAVRTMVVASGEGAYGSVEKMTPVKKPLMILATLPRVLGPGETLKLPVNVFAMESKVKNVNVSVSEKSGLVNLNGGSSKAINFDKPGDGLVEFDIQVKENVGVAKFTITAQGGGEKTTQNIEIDVRNPNPIVTDVYNKVLNANESWSQDYKLAGMAGTNEGILEISNIPPINLGERLEYLLQYPYGCLEQTLSGGFPQLYVNKLIELNEQQKKSVPNNIKATIDRLKQFQTDNGGFAYWPGQSAPDQWSTSYAGHFLLEARKLGYNVPNNLLDRWENFQKKAARMWDPKLNDYGYGATDTRSHELNQAYRLYTLALADDPEMGAMNRLRESKNLSLAAKWRLAAAYAVAGKPEVAKNLTQSLSRSVTDYRELSYTYGSSLRDEAMILETLVLMGNKSAAAEMVRDVANDLSAEQWLSTQETGFALLAIGKFVGNSEVGKRYTFTYTVGGKTVNGGSTTPLMQIQVPTNNGGSKVSVKNTSQATLFARLILRGQPVAGAEKAAANNLTINVVYKTTDGQKLDPASLAQGTDFLAEVTVKHPGNRAIPYRELALTQIFPSGWEILPVLTSSAGENALKNTAKPDYQDFRDDRVHTFFDLLQNQSVTFTVRLNAAYQGRYYLPATACEAMYDHSITARAPGRWVEVVVNKEI